MQKFKHFIKISLHSAAMGYFNRRNLILHEQKVNRGYTSVLQKDAVMSLHIKLPPFIASFLTIDRVFRADPPCC